ncbi:MAG: winged helix-turn-helix domain-containing protein [Solirubrobacterales bacterium]
MQARALMERKKRIAEVVSFALNHRIRLMILIVLNEGVYTPAKVAELIGEPLRTVSNHIRDLADLGAIELVDTVMRRNMPQRYYRTVKMPEYTEEDFEAMTPQQRDITWGLIIQSMAAELMAALWKGTLRRNNKTVLTWRWHNVDDQGELEIYDVLERAWERMWEIEGESVNRVAETKAKTRSILVALGGLWRAKKGPDRWFGDEVTES